MNRIERLVGTALAVGALSALAMPSAHAARPVEFTIHQDLNFNTGEFTFTATGPLCPSGTFEDSPRTFGADNILIDTIYMCDDGSGSFYAKKHVHGLPEGGSSGPISFHGGTGSYTDLRGHGVDSGEFVGDGIAEAEIVGVIVSLG